MMFCTWSSYALASPAVLPSEDVINLQDHLEYLVDPSSGLSVSEVEFSDDWQSSKLPSIPKTGTNIWLRFSLKNESDSVQNLFLRNASLMFNYVDVYQTQVSSPTLLKTRLGDMPPEFGRSRIYQFQLAPFETREYLVRLSHNGTFLMPLKLFNAEQWEESRHSYIAMLGAFYGAILILVIGYLVIIRLRFGYEHGFYLASVCFSVLCILQLDGLLHTWELIHKWASISNVELFLYLYIGSWALFAHHHEQQYFGGESSYSVTSGSKRSNAALYHLLAAVAFLASISCIVGIGLGYNSIIDRIYPLTILAILVALILCNSLLVTRRWRGFILVTSFFTLFVAFSAVWTDIFGTASGYDDVKILRIAFIAQLFFGIYTLSQQALHRVQRKLKQQQEKEFSNSRNIEIEQLIHSLSANLRTPLSSITGMVGLIRNQALDNHQRHCVDIIERSTLEIARTMDDIEEYNISPSEPTDLREQYFNLEDCIIDSCHLFYQQAVNKNLEIVHQPRAEFPRQLLGDQQKIRKVITRLLSNAIKHSSNNDITIETTLSHCNESNKINIIVWVCNPLHKDQLYKAENLTDFFANSGNNNSIKGLEVSRLILKNMGGKLLHKQQQGRIKVGFSLALKPGPIPVKMDKRALTDQHCLLISPKNLRSEGLIESLDSWRMKISHIHNVELLDQDYLARHDFDCCIIDSDDPVIFNAINAHFLRKFHTLMPPAVFISHSLRQPNFNQENHVWQTRSLAKPIHRDKLKVLLKKMVILKTNIDGDYVSISNNAPPPLGFTLPLDIEEKKIYNKHRALIAEDNLVNRQVVRSLLDRLGVQSTVVANGCEAIDRLCETNRDYTIVLMDCDMPEMDGFEATRKIRQYEKRNQLKPIPIIAVTSHNSRASREQAHSAGMNSYIRKPISLEILKRELDTILSPNNNKVVRLNS